MSTTANVVVTQSGTGFLVDVTACNLDPSAQIKDFVALTGAPPAIANQANWVKVNQTTVQYTGTALASGTRVEIRRRTQYDPYALAAYQTFINFSDYNRELQRATRIFYEQALNGINSTGNLSNSVIDLVYGVDWATDTLNSASRRRLYEMFESKLDKAGGTITGNVSLSGTAALSLTAGNLTVGGTLLVGQGISTVVGNIQSGGAMITGSNPGITDLSQIVASTAWIRNGLANGNWNITCATPGASSNNNDTANTAWIRTHLAGTPALGAATVTAPALSDDSTRIISSAWLRSWVSAGQFYGNATANTQAANGTSTGVVTIGHLDNRLLLAVALSAPSASLTNNVFSALPAASTWTIYKQLAGVGLSFSSPSAGTWVAPYTGWYRVTGRLYFFNTAGTPAASHFLLYLGSGVTVVQEINRVQFSPAYTGQDNGVSGSIVVRLTQGTTYFVGYYMGAASGTYRMNAADVSLEWLGA